MREAAYGSKQRVHPRRTPSLAVDPPALCPSLLVLAVCALAAVNGCDYDGWIASSHAMANEPAIARGPSPQRFLVLNVDPTASRARFTTSSNDSLQGMETPVRGQLFIDPARLGELSGVLHFGDPSQSAQRTSGSTMRLTRVVRSPARDLGELAREPHGLVLAVETTFEGAGGSVATRVALKASADVRDGQLVGIHLAIEEPVEIATRVAQRPPGSSQPSDSLDSGGTLSRIHLTGSFHARPGSVAVPSSALPSSAVP